MKKKYVVPESKLYAINIKENIAGSDLMTGDDAMSGQITIRFTHGGSPCREYYTGDMTAVVTITNGNFMDYYHELYAYAKKNPITYLNCFYM